MDHDLLLCVTILFILTIINIGIHAHLIHRRFDKIERMLSGETDETNKEST